MVRLNSKLIFNLKNEKGGIRCEVNGIKLICKFVILYILTYKCLPSLQWAVVSKNTWNWIHFVMVDAVDCSVAQEDSFLLDDRWYVFAFEAFPLASI